MWTVFFVEKWREGVCCLPVWWGRGGDVLSGGGEDKRGGTLSGT